MKCKICEKDFISYKALSSHIRQTHKLSSDIYYIKYIDSRHTCKICGCDTSFINLTNGFHIYCSNKCSNSDTDKIDKQNTTFKSNPANSIKARQNITAYNKSEKGRNNSRKVGLCTGSANITKAHKNNDVVRWCEICKANTKHIIGIGCMSCYNKSESHKESIVNTIKHKYGNQYSNVYQLPTVKDKIKSISMTRYGISNPGNSRNARIKASFTMRQNGNYSKDEDHFAEELSKYGIKYITQYKSEKYPFLCDFYLPDFDTYIELNIYWSHNNHFFDENNKDDLNTLNLWKDKAAKGHKQYNNAINVWTRKDLLKRDIAKNNNLNYIVLWSKQDINSYIKLLKEIIELKDI